MKRDKVSAFGYLVFSPLDPRADDMVKRLPGNGRAVSYLMNSYKRRLPRDAAIHDVVDRRGN